MGPVSPEDVFQVVEAILGILEVVILMAAVTLEVVIPMEVVTLETMAEVIPGTLEVVFLVEDRQEVVFQVEDRQDHRMALRVPLACLIIPWETGMHREMDVLPRKLM